MAYTRKMTGMLLTCVEKESETRSSSVPVTFFVPFIPTTFTVIFPMLALMFRWSLLVGIRLSLRIRRFALIISSIHPSASVRSNFVEYKGSKNYSAILSVGLLFWSAAPKGSMNHALTRKGNSLLLHPPLTQILTSRPKTQS